MGIDRQRVTEVLIYLGCAALVVASILVYAEYSAPGSHFPTGPVWLVTLTVLVFGYAAWSLSAGANLPGPGGVGPGVQGSFNDEGWIASPTAGMVGLSVADTWSACVAIP